MRYYGRQLQHVGDESRRELSGLVGVMAHSSQLVSLDWQRLDPI